MKKSQCLLLLSLVCFSANAKVVFDTSSFNSSTSIGSFWGSRCSIDTEYDSVVGGLAEVNCLQSNFPLPPSNRVNCDAGNYNVVVNVRGHQVLFENAKLSVMATSDTLKGIRIEWICFDQ